MTTSTVNSADGTAIAFDRLGNGPPLILASGAFNTRDTTSPLAAVLRDRFTVFNYDRRGRGDSGDAPSYAVEGEIEDIDALIGAAGGSAALFGYSSGPTLALKAAAHGLTISKLALYDVPFLVDDSHQLLPADFAAQLARLITTGERGEAVELYQRVAVGIPEQVIAQMRNAPFRPALERIAHTLVYDAMVIEDRSFPTELVASLRTPTMVITGEFSPPVMHGAAEALAHAPGRTPLHAAGTGP